MVASSVKTNEERKAYKKAWYEANKERIAAEYRARYATDREKYLAKANAYAAANRELLRVKSSADPDHYERITNTGEKVCYVCDKPFKKKDNIMYDGTLSKGPHFGEKIYKHRKCNPFSIHWFHKFNGCPGLINNGGSYMLTKKYKRKHHQQELDIESLIKGGEET